MSNSLSFQNTTFETISRSGEPWIRGYQIGSALKYTRPDVQIAKIYRQHADEFTPSMTAVITLPTPGGPQETRIFSLRGCHLIAMFARTPVAKEFRKWVLDVLESLNKAQSQPKPKKKVAGLPLHGLPRAAQYALPSTDFKTEIEIMARQIYATARFLQEHMDEL